MAEAQKAAAAAVDPMEDPANREKVELARNFTFHLLKGVKQIGMYRHAEQKFPEFLASAHKAIVDYTTQHGPLQMKVEQQNLLLMGQNLFSEDTNLPYKFFRDGIRQLIFRPDLTTEELVAFTMIALSEPERGAEDILAQLWKSQLEHVEYVVVEGFKMDESAGSDEDVQVEVDKVVSYLYQRLKTDSDDYLRFARVSAEDLEAKVEGVDQIRGAVVTGNTATDDLKAKLQKEIMDEEGGRLFPKLVSAIFQVVEGGIDDPQLLEEVFVQLLDAMLIQEDLATVNSILLKLKALEKKDGAGNYRRLRDFVVQKMGEEQRLNRIGEMLKQQKPKNGQDIQRYLQALGSDSILPLLNVLESIEVAENRPIIIDVLAPFCKEIEEPFVHRLESERPQTVRDMVALLEKANHPEKLKLIAGVLKHKNLAVRLEVLNVISLSKSGEARKLIVEALQDPNQQIRLLALKLLPDVDRDKAYSDIMRMIKDPSFEKKVSDEKAAIYAALGSTGVPGAMTLLIALTQQKSNLLNKNKVLGEKLLAIHGLAGACTIQAFKVLQTIVEDKNQPPEVLVAARKAMYSTKRALFGDSAGSEGAA